MDEILTSLIKNIGKGTFKTIFYVVVISMFWQVGIYMFKPDFLKELIVILKYILKVLLQQVLYKQLLLPELLMNYLNNQRRSTSNARKQDDF